MTAYFEGRHNPQQALPARIGYVATADNEVIGYTAGHRTRRYSCDGEVQYLFVAPAYRRQGVASGLLRSLARWFDAEGVAKVCVDVNVTSPGAEAFYASQGASRLNDYWYVWEDFAVILESHRGAGE